MKMDFKLFIVLISALLLISCEKEPNVALRLDCGEFNSEDTYLTLNDKPIGQCPLDIMVHAGQIKIEAHREYEDKSFRHVEQNLTLAENTMKKINLDMSKLHFPEPYWYQRVTDLKTAEEYIANYPNGANLSDVEQRLPKYIELSIWNETSNKLSALQEYADKYPSGEFISEANTKIAEILAENEAKRIKEKKQKAARIAAEKTGTVTIGNLTWMRCSLGQKWNNKSKSCDGKAHKFKWNKAMTKAKKHSYAGFNDWRVPAIEELESIIFCNNGEYRKNKEGRAIGCPKGHNKPTINKTKFPNTPNAEYDEDYWSSLLDADHNDNAWLISFYDGVYNYATIRYYYAYVRLVRSR